MASLCGTSPRHNTPENDISSKQMRHGILSSAKPLIFIYIFQGHILKLTVVVYQASQEQRGRIYLSARKTSSTLPLQELWELTRESEHTHYRHSLSFYGNCGIFPLFPENYCNGFVVLASLV